MTPASKSTQWQRAGFGWWRREGAAVLRVRTHRGVQSLASAFESLTAEVSLDGVMVLSDRGLATESAAQAWCERWARVLIAKAARERAEECGP